NEGPQAGRRVSGRRFRAFSERRALAVDRGCVSGSPVPDIPRAKTLADRGHRVVAPVGSDAASVVVHRGVSGGGSAAALPCFVRSSTPGPSSIRSAPALYP